MYFSLYVSSNSDDDDDYSVQLQSFNKTLNKFDGHIGFSWFPFVLFSHHLLFHFGSNTCVLNVMHGGAAIRYEKRLLVSFIDAGNTIFLPIFKFQMCRVFSFCSLWKCIVIYIWILLTSDCRLFEKEIKKCTNRIQKIISDLFQPFNLNLFFRSNEPY